MPRTIKRESDYEREGRRWMERVRAVEPGLGLPVVEGWLRRGESRLLTGPRWSGKSAFAARLAAAVSWGEPFEGRATRRTNVLFLATDRGPNEWALELGSVVGETDRWSRVGFGPLGLDREAGMLALRAQIEAGGVGLLVIDPFEGAVERRCFARTLAGIEAMCREKDVAGLVVGEFRELGA